MDIEGETYDTTDDFKVICAGTNDSESKISRKIQSNSLEDTSTLENVSNSSSIFESSFKNSNCTMELDNNLICKIMQNKQVHEATELSIENEIEMRTDKCYETKKILEKIMCTTTNSIDISEAITSQDNSPSTANDIAANESYILHTDQNKIKRSISKGQVHPDSGISMEKSDDCSDEDSSKRQKLNKSTSDTDIGNDTVTFQRMKSKVKQRNYRKRRNVMSDNEDNYDNVLFNETTRESSILDADEGDYLFCYASYNFEIILDF